MADEFQSGLTSPGGFVFGVQGWNWGEPRPKTITFFLDNTAMVCDQHGRPIRGTESNGKKVEFATKPPQQDEPVAARAALGTHQEVIAALTAEAIDWKRLTWAGWPQVPYEELKKLPQLPPTPEEELRKISNMQLRKDALRARREHDEELSKQMQVADAE